MPPWPTPETQDDASVSKHIKTGRSGKGGFVWGYVRFGSIADMCAAKSHVRSTLESGHLRCNGHIRFLQWHKSVAQWNVRNLHQAVKRVVQF